MTNEPVDQKRSLAIANGFASRLLQARSLAGLTQAELAKRAGIVARQISVYENGGALPRLETASRLASALGTTANWLLEGDESLPSGYIVPSPGLVPVPVISWVQARHILDDPLLHTSPDEYVPSIVSVGDRAFALRIEGDSMLNPTGSPSFPDGSIVIFDPDAAPLNTCYCLIKANENLAFRRVSRDLVGLVTQPLNPNYPASHLNCDEIEIVAKAVATFTAL